MGEATGEVNAANVLKLQLITRQMKDLNVQLRAARAKYNNPSSDQERNDAAATIEQLFTDIGKQQENMNRIREEAIESGLPDMLEAAKARLEVMRQHALAASKMAENVNSLSERAGLPRDPWGRFHYGDDPERKWYTNKDVRVKDLTSRESTIMAAPLGKFTAMALKW